MTNTECEMCNSFKDNTQWCKDYRDKKIQNYDICPLFSKPLPKIKWNFYYCLSRIIDFFITENKTPKEIED